MDEIGDIPLAMQVKLLRFLRDRIYERLGDVKPVRANVRLIAASHQDLGRLVEERRFRQDLFYRINVINVHLPPLGERRGDIPVLVQRFLERLSTRRGKQVTDIAHPALELLQGIDFPGNIRELENIVEHAYVLCNGPTVHVEHLPPRVQSEGGRGVADSRDARRHRGEFSPRLQLKRHGIIMVLQRCAMASTRTALGIAPGPDALQLALRQ